MAVLYARELSGGGWNHQAVLGLTRGQEVYSNWTPAGHVGEVES